MQKSSCCFNFFGDSTNNFGNWSEKKKIQGFLFFLSQGEGTDGRLWCFFAGDAPHSKLFVILREKRVLLSQHKLKNGLNLKSLLSIEFKLSRREAASFRTV